MRTALVAIALLLSMFAQSTAAYNLLDGRDLNGRAFEEFEIGYEYVSYFHQRMLGEAIVEQNHIVYIFDQTTHERLERKVRWREDLPEQLPMLQRTAQDAEALVDGAVLFTKLYIISPESDVFPLDPTPENPSVRRVYELADAGRSPIQAAEELEMTLGEVELVLNLRRYR